MDGSIMGAPECRIGLNPIMRISKSRGVFYSLGVFTGPYLRREVLHSAEDSNNQRQGHKSFRS